MFPTPSATAGRRSAFGRTIPLHRLLPLIPAWLALAAPDFATAAEPAVTVAAVAATRQDLARELTLQAELRPRQEIDLHAKVAGYLHRIDVDIGDQLKAGDAIALLEVPELKEDLARSRAALQRAEANQREAQLGLERLTNVSRTQPQVVAQQELDAATAKAAALGAAVAEARADLEKMRAMEGYTRITAPFAGVVTKRYADAGALIQAGTSSSTQAMPLVRLSQNDQLRVSFPVSVSYAANLRVGDPLEVDVGDRRTRKTTQIARLSRRIVAETRTMLVEADLPNPGLELIPGMYATVTLKFDRRPQALTVPVEAVGNGKQRTLAVVTAAGTVEERAVQLGLETPSRIEVLQGLRDGELVLIGNRAQVQTGQQVTVKRLDQPQK